MTKLLNDIVKKWAAPAVILTLLAVVYVIGLERASSITRNLALADGVIYESDIKHRGWVNISYEFEVNGQLFRETQVLAVPSQYYSLFMKRQFPVAYNSKRPEANRMLILPKDFDEHNIKFPDSLVWVKKLLTKYFL